jgi:hypothetical protein
MISEKIQLSDWLIITHSGVAKGWVRIPTPPCLSNMISPKFNPMFSFLFCKMRVTMAFLQGA